MYEAIDHIAIVVEDIDHGIEFFENVYGLECWGTNSEAHRREHGIDRLFRRWPGRGEHVSSIEDGGNGGWAAERLVEYGAGFFHIVYSVADIAKAMATLTDCGVRLLDAEPAMGYSGEIVTLHPDDTILPTQIVQPNGPAD